jgi:hypothetical protein
MCISHTDMANKKKTMLLQIRLTPEEKQLFTQEAERFHVTLSTWIRLAALAYITRQTL